MWEVAPAICHIHLTLNFFDPTPLSFHQVNQFLMEEGMPALPDKELRPSREPAGSASAEADDDAERTAMDGDGDEYVYDVYVAVEGQDGDGDDAAGVPVVEVGAWG